MSRRVIFFELNEVPWRILDDHVAAHGDSALADTLRASRQFTSVAPDVGHLSPWITWPTVHRGVSNEHHGFTDLGQDASEADRRYPPYWALAQRAGHSVGVFGPLHTHPLPTDVERYEFWLPDTFASDDAAHPASLRPFQAFNLAMARASARNVDTSIDVKGALAFLGRAPFQGLRPATVATIASQLVDERRRPWTRVRRRSLQSVLAFDLFFHQLRRRRPALSVMFTNHVASALHRYWAARYPDDYDPATYAFDDAWQQRYRSEIDSAMGHADRMVGRLRSFVDRDPRHLLVVASSMGQAAAQGTPVRELLLLRDAASLARAAGLVDGTWEQRAAMDPKVSIAVHDQDSADRLRVFLEALKVGGRDVLFSFDDKRLCSMEFGQADAAIGEVTVGDRAVEPDEVGLARVSIEDEAGSSGYHTPEGSLWVYDPTRPTVTRGPTGKDDRPRVPNTAIAPAVLRAIGVTPPPHHCDDDFDLVPRLIGSEP